MVKMINLKLPESGSVGIMKKCSMLLGDWDGVLFFFFFTFYCYLYNESHSSVFLPLTVL